MKRKWLCGLLAAALALTMLSGLPLQIDATENMASSEEMVDVLKKMEGFLKYPMWDNSQWTVGYGTRCPDDKVEEYKARGITEEEAEALLRQMLKSFENEVNSYMNRYSLTLEQHQFDALVSLTYNCGGAWAREANGYLNIAVRTGATDSELIYAMSLYSKAHTDYVLIRRRMAEANMYINGEYKAYNYHANPYPSTYKHVFLEGNGGVVQYAIHGYDAADPMEVVAGFTRIPTGVDENGNPFVYEFAGWYTASTGGTKVEKLDGSLPNATVLYAQWRVPGGEIVALPKGEAVDNLEITINSLTHLRSGPATFYAKLSELEKDTTVTVTEVFDDGNLVWGRIEQGWISLAYTNYKDVLASQQPEPTWPREGTVTGNGVNIRSGPGTSYEVRGQKNSGDRVTIYETSDDGTLQWGKLEDGNWICLSYVAFDSEESEEEPTVTGITLLQEPARKEYVQMQDELDPMGSVLQVSYSDGSISAMTLIRSMVSGFSNAKLGEITLTAKYQGYTATFTVNIVKATVTFLNYDGTVLSSAQYAYGETVAEPETPVKPADETGSYIFVGWDKEVVPCDGDATYTAVFESSTETFTVTFRNYDGTVLSQTEYLRGETVTEPETPVRAEDEHGTYEFVGWDREVTACAGDATYTAIFEMVETPEGHWPRNGTVIGSQVNVRIGPGVIYDKTDYQLLAGDAVQIQETVYDGSTYWWGKLEDGNWVCLNYVELEPAYTPGDFDGNETVNEDDAIYLLRHVFFPEDYPVEIPADYTGNGVIDEDDAIYLLRHVFFPGDYPLTDPQ